jgi:hypothetical protein
MHRVLKTPLKAEQRAAIESDQRIMEVVQIKVDALEAQMQKDAWEVPRVKLLMTLYPPLRAEVSLVS